MNPTLDSKTKTVNQKNTYYFVNHEFEQSYNSYIISLNEKVSEFQNSIKVNGFGKKVFGDLLQKEDGLLILLALTGFSMESLLQLITLIRLVNDQELIEITDRNSWYPENSHSDKSWGSNKVQTLVKKDANFRKCIVNIFFDADKSSFLKKYYNLFELKKLGSNKLKDIESLSLETVDTLLRYKLKGSYAATKENNPETVIESLLEKLDIPFTRGDLPELTANESIKKRTMDFIIPNKEDPRFIIESSYLVTTSSGSGDKAKTENLIASLLAKYYPKAKFIGFVDGIGWITRQEDMKRMANAYHDVFTFDEGGMKKFEKMLVETFNA